MIGGVLNVVQRQRIPFGSGGPIAQLDLNFLSSTYLMGSGSYAFQDLIRFSRTSAGTFTGSNGLIQNSPISNNLLLWTEEFENAAWTKVAAAVQSNLLLRSQEYDNASWIKNTAFIETNLLRYSEEFDNAAWTKVRATVATNAIIAPDGASTADKIVEDTTASNTHFISQSISYTAGITYTLSLYIKAGERNWFDIQLPSSIMGTLRNAFFDVSSGTIGTVTSGVTAAITSVGDGWYRCSVTFTPTTSASASAPYLIADADNSISYTGDGTSGIYVWGAQIVQGTAPGNYQRTEAAALAVGYTAPDGTLTADKLVIDSAAPFSSSYIRQNISKGATPLTYTTSVYAKAGEFNRIRLFVRENAAGANSAFVTVSLVDGSIVSAANAIGTFTNASATVTSVGSGWYRIALTFTTGTETNIWGQTVFAEDSVATTGDGASGIYVWGSQLVNGPVAETYQPTAASVVAIQHLAPNGVLSANKIVENGSSAYHYAREAVTAANGAHTFTVYLKAGERTRAIVSMSDIATGDAYIGVDLTNGTTFTPTALSIGSWTAVSSSVTSVGNGWYRVRVTGTKGAGTQIAGSVFPTNGTSATFLGDGSSGFYAWGAQLEVGSSETAYSRNADGRYAPRFDYDPVTLEAKGLLIEEQRANLLTYSEQFDNAVWLPGTPGAVTITADATTSPDGTVDADKLIIASGVSSATATTYLYTNISKSAVSTTYTFSCYAKEAEYDVFRILINDNAASANFALAAWSLVDGSVSEAPSVSGTFTNPSGTATAVGNGWYRITLTFTSSTETVLRVRIYPRDSSGVVVGDGVSGIYIWGAQLEAGAFATSYIPTVASTVTRAADIALVTGGAFTSWHNVTAGTLFAEVIPETVNLFNQFLATISDGTTSNRAGMFKSTASLLGARMTVNGIATNPGSPAFPFPAGVASKAAFAFSTGTNNLSGALNGTLGTAATLAAMPSNQNTLCIGVNESATANWLNGRVRGVRYFNTRLTNAELQTVTT